MTIKKLLRYSLLPILAVLIIPNWGEGTFPGKWDVIIAIIAGTITGCIRCFWNNQQQLKQMK